MSNLSATAPSCFVGYRQHFVYVLDFVTIDRTRITSYCSVLVYLVVVAGVDVARHAEVRDLHDEFGADEAVPRRQVAMHEVLWRQIEHPVSDLRRDVYQVRLSTGDTKCCHVR